MPYLPGALPLLYAEDFSQDSNWPQDATAEREFATVDGEYRIRILQAQWLDVAFANGDFSDCIIETDAIQKENRTDTDYGLFFRVQDPENYYVFRVASNGQFALRKKVGGTGSALIDWTDSPAIRIDGATNRLSVHCQENRFVLSINATEVGEVEDNSFTRGDIGLYAGSELGNAEVFFDNLRVFGLTEVSPSTPSAVPTSVLTLTSSIPTIVFPPSNTPTSSLLFSDLFSDPTSGWIEQDKADAKFRYDQGQYRILVSPTNWSVWSYAPPLLQSFSLVVNTQLVGGPEHNGFGLYVQDQVSENCYFFRLSSEGQCALRKKAGGEWSQPLDWQSSPAVHSGRSLNRVELIRQQDRFSFLVNGTLVTEQTGTSFGAVKVGLYVETFEEGDLEVAFDDLFIWSIP
jgi:hypothetical protein